MNIALLTLPCITLHSHALSYIANIITFLCRTLPLPSISDITLHYCTLCYIYYTCTYTLMHAHSDVYIYVYTYFQKCIYNKAKSLSLFIWVFFDLLMVLLTKSQKHTGPNRHLSASDVLSQASDWSLPTGFLVKAAVEVIRIAFGRRAEKAV